MDFVQEPGNKNFLCPACQRPIQISIRLGYQSFICSRTNKEVSIEDQIRSFKDNGYTIGVESYSKHISGNQVVINATRFPVLGEWCYQVVNRQGFPDMEAYSIALARARVTSNRPRIRTLPEYVYDGKVVTPRGKELSTIEVIDKRFMGLYTPVTIRPDGQYRGIYYKNDVPQLCKPDMFDSIVIDKLKHKPYKTIHNLLTKLADVFSAKDLEKYGTFLWNVFAPITKKGTKPEPGEMSYFRITAVEDLINTFTVPKSYKTPKLVTH